MDLINWWGVLLGAIISMIIGFLWYSPTLFGKEWMKLQGIDPNDKAKLQAGMKGVWKLYLTSFIGSLVMTLVLSYFIHVFNQDGAAEGARIAFLAWLGFVVPTSISVVLYEQKPKMLWYINTSYNLVTLLIIGAVIGAWF